MRVDNTKIGPIRKPRWILYPVFLLPLVAITWAMYRLVVGGPSARKSVVVWVILAGSVGIVVWFSVLLIKNLRTIMQVGRDRLAAATLSTAKIQVRLFETNAGRPPHTLAE